MATLTISRDRLHELRTGDRIIRIDDMPADHTVTRTFAPQYEGGPASLGVVRPNGITANIYSDTFSSTVTIKRGQPKPAVRVFDGVRLVRTAGEWQTEDGRYLIRYGFGGLTECEADHPVRLTADLVMRAKECPGTGWAQPILDAYRRGARGFVCQGGTEHSYDAWQVWDTVADDYADGLQWCDSFRDAAEGVAALVNAAG